MLLSIHKWIFNKIIILEKLEIEITKNVSELLDIDISIIIQNAYSKYGTPSINDKLEQIVDKTNIHRWLQDKIDKTEYRHAFIIAELLYEHRKGVYKIIQNAYKEQGKICGIEAKSKYNIITLNDLKKAICDHILDGMPIDSINDIVSSEKDLIRWKIKNSVHKKYWDNVKKDVKILYNLRSLWIIEFIKEINKNIAYSFEIIVINDSELLIHQIKTTRNRLLYVNTV